MSSTKHTALSTKWVVGRCLVLSAYCLVLSLIMGCVTRSLTIKTEPPGALVYVNDQLKGHSPVTYDFEWYGWHRLTLRKEGYQRLDDRQQLRSPVYLWIPFDPVMELLPFRISDARTWSYTLTPATVMPTPVPPNELGYPPQVGERGSPVPQPAASGSSLRDPERERGSTEGGGTTTPQEVPSDETR